MHTKLAWRLCLLIVQTHAFTHWIVTENGRIEPKLDTHFYMRRPYDLIALLDQEKRRDELDALVQDMEKQRNLIDHKSLQTSFIYNQDCAKVPKDIPNSIVASNASDRVFYRLQPAEPHVKVEAMCTRFHYLPFSMRTFEHLDAMQSRKDSKEETCEDCLPEMNWEAVGPTIVSGLEENSTSWVHYNLGILYWWRLGNLYEAIECARRAIHFAPLEYIDIPLANLGNLLYLHGEKFEDALMVIRAAIDHAPNEAKYYLLLGEAYIHKGEFESGVKCFEKFKTLHIAKNRLERGHLEDSAASALSMSCILKALIGMKEYQDMLQGILSDLHDFHTKQQRWLSLQERFFWEIAPNEFKMSLALSEQLTASSLNINTYKGFKNNIEKMLDSYKDKLGQNEQTPEAFKDAIPIPLEKTKDEQTEDENLVQKYPTSMNVPDNLYFDSSKWPSREECTEWNLPLTEEEDLNLPIVLPPENKGYDMIKFLSTDIDMPEDQEHPLPWYPPVCETAGYDYVAKFLPDEIKNIVDKNKPLTVNKLFKTHFLSYINQGNSNEAEIGQRIVSAMKAKKAPAWTLAILANMYWRIRGNTRNAIHCLSMYVEPMAGSADVAFVSLGSMLYQMGLIDNALKFANLAARVNFNEPSTNFLLALIYYKKQNPIKALFYLKKVLRVDFDYYDGEAEKLLKLWECRIKLGEYELKPTEEDKPGDICTDTSRSEGVICSPNGEQCKTAAIQCFKQEKRQKIIHMNKELEEKQCTSTTNTAVGPGSLISTMMHSGRDPQEFQMRILFGHDTDALTQSGMPESSLGDFYVSVAMSEEQGREVMLNVYDKSGTYVLSKTKCNDIKEADWLHFTSLWDAFASRNIDIAPYLMPLLRQASEVRPYCLTSVKPESVILDKITAMILRRHLPHIPEEGIAKWLGLMASDLEASVAELGAKIGTALNENNTSWILATAAALYWRVVGNTEEAVTCIRQALTYVPADMKDIPLTNLASILQKMGHFHDALEIMELAMQANPNFVVNHFHAGNIYTALGDYENAVALYRSSLALDVNFEPARNRLQAILCTLLFDETRTIRESSES